MHGPSLQTFDATAQDLERQIRQVWRVLDENPDAHRNSPALRSRLAEIVTELGKLKIEYDDWQVVYRQALQLGRALSGEPQVLQWVAREEGRMAEQDDRGHERIERPLSGAPTSELVSTLVQGSTDLVRKEVELAKAELRDDIHREVQMAAGVGIGAVFGVVALTLLFVAGAFALSTVWPGWVGALAVAALALVISVVAAVTGWARRVRRPLDKTEKTLKEDVRWVKERLT